MFWLVVHFIDGYIIGMEAYIFPTELTSAEIMRHFLSSNNKQNKFKHHLKRFEYIVENWAFFSTWIFFTNILIF